MSVALSRRVARLMVFAPIRDMAPAERRQFADAVHAASAFQQLPPAFQEMIQAAEAARDQLRTVQRTPVQPTRSSDGVRAAR